MHAAASALLVSLSLAAAVAAGGGGSKEPVELEVLGVVPLESEGASLLLLREKGARTVLPIFVGRGEGAVIEQRLKRERAPRGPGGDLLESTIAALGGKVMRVDIDGAQPPVFSAHVTLQQGARKLDVEARPSDSVALAISASAPIFASRAVLAESGLTEKELSRMRPRGGGDDEEWQRVGPEVSF